jgi:hypothetical protein
LYIAVVAGLLYTPLGIAGVGVYMFVAGIPGIGAALYIPVIGTPYMVPIIAGSV